MKLKVCVQRVLGLLGCWVFELRVLGLGLKFRVGIWGFDLISGLQISGFRAIQL